MFPNFLPIFANPLYRPPHTIKNGRVYFNSSISRFTVRVIASLIKIFSQCILTLFLSRAGLNQNNTPERYSKLSNFPTGLVSQHYSPVPIVWQDFGVSDWVDLDTLCEYSHSEFAQEWTKQFGTPWMGMDARVAVEL